LKDAFNTLRKVRNSQGRWGLKALAQEDRGRQEKVGA